MNINITEEEYYLIMQSLQVNRQRNICQALSMIRNNEELDLESYEVARFVENTMKLLDIKHKFKDLFEQKKR